ncbi:MAG: zf-HC2 domain-containing protein [Deltaproteobacteria bacterium]|nr:zf-HC2 domain-containing protein [Deltaproteobacteria bacterium]
MMTCKDLVDLLSEYVDGELDAATARQLEEHLRDCVDCKAFLDTFRRARTMTRAAVETAMPVELRARLRRFLRDRLTLP